MKNIKDIEVKQDLAPEETTEFSFDAEEFDPTTAYLELPEELDKKVVTYIEREVRSSYEYRNYINYLKTELDMTRCSLLPQIDVNNVNVSLEFHHYPMNLFEIVEAVGKKMIFDAGEGKSVSCFDIAQKVVEEHYKNNIGLVPLTKSLHEMAHSRAIIIPMSKVYGNYKNFMIRYSKSIDKDIQDRVMEAEMNSESDDATLYNKSKLEKNVSHYNITYKKPGDDGSDSEGVNA